MFCITSLLPVGHSCGCPDGQKGTGTCFFLLIWIPYGKCFVSGQMIIFTEPPMKFTGWIYGVYPPSEGRGTYVYQPETNEIFVDLTGVEDSQIDHRVIIRKDNMPI